MAVLQIIRIHTINFGRYQVLSLRLSIRLELLSLLLILIVPVFKDVVVHSHIGVDFVEEIWIELKLEFVFLLFLLGSDLLTAVDP